MMLRKLALPIAVAAGLTAAAPALASSPSSGTVSASAPELSWTGTAKGYGVIPTNLLLTGAGQDPVCPPAETGTCDRFTLTVADQADLVVNAECFCSNNFMELHVRKPDGTLEYVFGEQGAPAELVLPQAAPGDYAVEVLTNEPVQIGSGGYFGGARLDVPPPA